MYLFIKGVIKQRAVIIEAYKFVSYVQNFIQHPAVNVNFICIGNNWGSSEWNSTRQSTTDHIFFIRQIIEKKWEYNETVHQLLIDFKKAYDLVRREVL